MGPSVWRRSLLSLAFLAVALLAVPPSADAETRVALVIGNGAYAKVGKLDNPVRDAGAVEKMLRDAGFDVVEVKRDLGNSAMRRALRDFSDRVRDADIAMAFYAGHGIEVNGTNYLIPIDAALERDIDVEDETVPLERVSQVLEPARRLRLVVLDACRDNPFVRSMRRTTGTRSIGRGLAKVEVLTSDTLFAYAARAGSTAEDGQGSNSPYTTALVRHLATPGLDVRLAFGRVRDDVLKSTGNRQEPFVYGSLGGASIALVPAAAAPVPPTVDTARVCRDVEGMSSATLLGLLASQYKGTPAAECITARLAELKRIETEKPGEPAALPSDAHPFDGDWILRISTTGSCAKGNSAWTWTWKIRQSVVEGPVNRGAARGTVSRSGQLVASFPAPIDASRTIRIVAKLQGSRGEGKYEGLDRCSGHVALTRR